MDRKEFEEMMVGLPDTTEQLNDVLKSGEVLMSDREGQLIDGVEGEEGILYHLYSKGECVNSVNDQYLYVCGYSLDH